MGKRSALLLIAILTVSSLIVVDWIPLGLAQSGTDESGILISDTTWTRSNSPYTLSSNVLVPNGVTLTIEAGVTINLRGFYVYVNGTLVAKGSDTNPISFIGGVYGVGSIIFTQYSTSWSSQSNSGSILEYVSAAVNITRSSPRITNCHLGLTNIDGGSSIISNNDAFEIDVFDGSPTISNNNFNVPLENNDLGQINVYGGSPIIQNNFINGTTAYMNNGDSRHPMLEQYFMPSFGILVDGVSANVQVTSNTITYHGTAGINVMAGNVTLSNNLISYNQVGISDQTFMPAQTIQNANLAIRDNTIIYNTFSGISNTYASIRLQITYNNIYSNGQYNIYLGSSLSGNSLNSNDVDAPNNWWGTSDEQAIKQTFYDFNEDFNLGKVNFVPFLTEPNPNAPAKPMPTPTPSPTSSLSPTLSPNPTPTPNQEPQTYNFVLIIGAAIIVIVIGTGLGLLIYFIKRK
jgi:hypothetical protein